jgi:hypothetical protein
MLEFSVTPTRGEETSVPLVTNMGPGTHVNLVMQRLFLVPPLVGFHFSGPSVTVVIESL